MAAGFGNVLLGGFCDPRTRGMGRGALGHDFLNGIESELGWVFHKWPIQRPAALVRRGIKYPWRALKTMVHPRLTPGGASLGVVDGGSMGIDEAAGIDGKMRVFVVYRSIGIKVTMYDASFESHHI